MDLKGWTNGSVNMKTINKFPICKIKNKHNEMNIQWPIGKYQVVQHMCNWKSINWRKKNLERKWGQILTLINHDINLFNQEIEWTSSRINIGNRTPTPIRVRY